jgi:predicted nuclease of restriction endonuclease-like (RecB) superfamily
MTEITLTKEYKSTLEFLKEQVRTARIKASLSVNKEMIILYWQIGNTILQRQQEEGWGAAVIDRLSKDLSEEFSEMKGFSSRNLRDMKMFASEYQGLFSADLSQENVIWQQLVANLPWGHNIRLMSGVKDRNQRLWYAQQTIDNGWSRNVLVLHIESNLYARQTQAEKITNFANTLPKAQSDLANETIKDPYKLEFLGVGKEASEKEIENSIMRHIRQFLLELGKDFAFVGQQYPLRVGDQDFYIDLLFYNIRLKSYVVIELKAGAFKPEYTGKMAFYLASIDDKFKDMDVNPAIGIILCQKKNNDIGYNSVKYITKPIGISEYTILDNISDELAKALPTVEEVETELQEQTKNDEITEKPDA